MTKTASNDNGWGEWKNFVLPAINEQKKTCFDTRHEISQKLTDIATEIAQLKVKSGIWGFIGGSIPVVTTLIVFLLRRFL